jgi:hypothetical protein
MEVLRYEVSGWAGVDGIDIVNPPRILEFAGDVGQGKTSAIEPILALAGGKSRVVDGPTCVRDGEEAAEATLQWEHEKKNWTARVRVNRSGTMTVNVTCDGEPMKPPREVLGKLFGKLFSPSDLRKWGDKEQRELLEEIAGPEWVAEMKRLDDNVDAAKSERTTAGRIKKSTPRPDEVDECKPVDESAINAEIQAAEEFNAVVREKSAEYGRAQERVQRAEDEGKGKRDKSASKVELAGKAARVAIDCFDKITALAGTEDTRAGYDAWKAMEKATADTTDLMWNAHEAAESLAELETEWKAATAALKALPEPAQEKPTDQLRDKLADASRANVAAAAYTRYLEDLAKYEAAQTAHQDAERAVKDSRKERDKHIRSAELPAGLEIGVDGLMWQDRPLSRASTGEGHDLCLQVALSSGHKLMVFDGAESVTPSVLEKWEPMLAEHGACLVITTVGKGHTPGKYEFKAGKVVAK